MAPALSIINLGHVMVTSLRNGNGENASQGTLHQVALMPSDVVAAVSPKGMILTVLSQAPLLLTPSAECGAATSSSFGQMPTIQGRGNSDGVSPRLAAS